MWRVRTGCFLGGFFWVVGRAFAESDALSELPEKLISQCGLVSGMLVAAVLWLAVQNAKARSGWEHDREGMLGIMTSQNTAYSALSASHSKLEGILLGLQQHNRR